MCVNCYVSVLVSGSVAWARASVIQWSMSGRSRARRCAVKSLSGIPAAGRTAPFTVEPRDAEGVQPRGQPAAVLLAVIRGRPAHVLTRTSRAGGPPCGLAYRASTPRQREPPVRPQSASTVNDG